MATDLANLRRARSRAHFALKQAEMQVESYAYKVAEIEAAIQAVAPDLNLPPRFYKPNPVFARNELPRLAIDILRHAGGPLATREIALRAFAAKWISCPDRRPFKVIRTRLVQFLSRMDAKGIKRKVGEGRATRRGLVREGE
jgi:hypothetical protein